MSHDTISVQSYGKVAVPHLEKVLKDNDAVMEKIRKRLVKDVTDGKSLLVFGSGHSSLFPMELYHRAGGASFLIPIVADYLLPVAGPPVVRVLERTPGVAQAILRRSEPKSGEMIWISSQSGINGAVVDLALTAKEMGLFVVAFTSRVHSSAVQSRHPSGKRLFEVADETVDLGGKVGDAALEVAPGVSAGPLSSLGSILMGHSILVAACADLEKQGQRVVYTSVNTPEGEKRNKDMEALAAKRDPLLR